MSIISDLSQEILANEAKYKLSEEHRIYYFKTLIRLLVANGGTLPLNDKGLKNVDLSKITILNNFERVAFGINMPDGSIVELQSYEQLPLLEKSETE